MASKAKKRDWVEIRAELNELLEQYDQPELVKSHEKARKLAVLHAKHPQRAVRDRARELGNRVLRFDRLIENMAKRKAVQNLIRGSKRKKN